MNKTDEQEFTPEEIALFEADAAEAERGYSLEFLLSRPVVYGRGRPKTLGNEAGQLIQFRYDPDRVRALDERAKAEQKSRSQVLRDAADAYLAEAA